MQDTDAPPPARSSELRWKLDFQLRHLRSACRDVPNRANRGGYPDNEGFSDEGGSTMTTDHVAQPWALRSTLVAVADLDRSIGFYGELGPFGVVAREDAIAVVGDASPGSIVLVLRA